MLLTSPLSSPLKNPVRDLFSPAGGAPLSLTAQVQALFASRVGGMWDMGDTSTLWRNPLFGGVNPVTTAGQTIGVVADVSRQSGFTDVSGHTWTVASGDGVLSVVGNQVTITGATTATRVDRTGGNIAAETRGLCKMVITANWASATGPLVWCCGNPTAPVNGVALTAGNQIENSTLQGFQITSGTATFTVDEFKMWPGSTATQSTAIKRPLFSARKNLLQKTEVLNDGIWIKQASVTVTDNAVVAPNGSMTGAQVDWTAAAVGHGIFQDGITKPANVPNTKTVYVRADSAGGTVELVDPEATVGSSLATLTTSWQPLVLTETTAYTAFGLWVRKTASSPNRIYIAQPQLELGSTSTAYQRVNTASDYDTVGFPAFAQFDATNDALLFTAITFGGAFNTFVAGKVTSGTQGVHLWRTADVNGTWAKYKSGDATTPTGTGSGSPTYAVNGTALSPSQQGQLYTQINGVDSVVESIGVVLTAETALQFSGFVGSLFTGNAHRVLMISGTLTAGEKLLCRQWCAEGNGVTVV